MIFDQSIPLCPVCGNESATDEHHLYRRGSHPDKIDERRNKIKIGRRCHERTEREPEFYEGLQKIFYQWQPGNVDIFMRAGATLDALLNGQDIEYLTPAMTDNYLQLAGAKYGYLNKEMGDLEKLWFEFCSERSKELRDQGEKATGVRLEMEWGNTTNGKKMIDNKHAIKSLENLQSNLRKRLDRFNHERYTRSS